MLRSIIPPMASQPCFSDGLLGAYGNYAPDTRVPPLLTTRLPNGTIFCKLVWPPDLISRGGSGLLKVVKKTRIPEEIVGQIRDLVRAGVLSPGDKLPPERDLAQQFGVSRASVREAMRLLDTRGLVIIRPGAGTYITEDTVEAVAQALSSLMNGRPSPAGDAFEMRLLLEPRVASLAAKRAGDEDIERMKAVLDSQGADIAAGGTGAEFDSEFHFSIATATKNSALIAVTQAISDILSQSRRDSLLSPERSRLSLQSHRQILAAIQKRRPRKALQAMQEHISDVDRQVHVLSPERAPGE